MQAVQHHQSNQRYFPPSPPASPLKVRKRNKKMEEVDQFLQLGHPQILAGSRPSSPPDAAEAPESLFNRIILTPFLFTSFLLSLFLIDTRNAISRAKPSTLVGFLDPEPYQDPLGSTTHVQPPDALNPDQQSGNEKKKRQSWHLHKKIRKMARLEIIDAFEMRRRVMVAMVVVLLTMMYAVWWVFVRVLNMF